MIFSYLFLLLQKSFNLTLLHYIYYLECIRSQALLHVLAAQLTFRTKYCIFVSTFSANITGNHCTGIFQNHRCSKSASMGYCWHSFAWKTKNMVNKCFIIISIIAPVPRIRVKF
jgi:hypothetical protein